GVCVLLLAAVLCSPALASEPALSDALKAPRPEGGEYFGVYLMSKKVGYLFTDLAPVPGAKGKARSVSELYFKANVGSGVSERQHKEVRTYESKPGGRLLSFTVEQKGDGGDQMLEGTATPAGVQVRITRPGQAPRSMTLPPVRETIEDADAPRVALLRKQSMEGSVLDAQDLGTYAVKTTVGAIETRTLGGVPVELRSATTVSSKEKVPVQAFLTEAGKMVEIAFGQTMRAVAEAPSVAKRLDKVEVFGLTRVVLPRALPDSVHSIPGKVTWVVSGLPDTFWKETSRQRYRALPDGRVEVTLSAAPPALTQKLPQPLAASDRAEYLKSSIVVEADHPDVRAAARKVAGGEKDPYRLAKKVSAWVSANLKKGYGASADRASDVLRQMKGDCTEHSLLTVALLRALGVPARRIDGLVYLVNEDKIPALYWHEWVEAYVGEWTQLDPTFGQPVADATHFALGEEGNAEITSLIGQLKVLEVR
ncbi:MAG TPA: transglutaminase domain-containing protein, partial [Myxococcaceae bacterium]|nr:transglutaminase domain-containing protein [Myxococcaceae bacterium]